MSDLIRRGFASFISLTAFWCAFFMVALGTACAKGPAPTSSTPESSSAAKVTPIDSQASEQTRALLHHMHQLKDDGVLFGHQDSLAYGVEWRQEPGRSDVKDVTGDYPAVYGWDIGNLEFGDTANLDGVDFGKMQAWMTSAYERGGIITISWHMNHPLTEEPAWETTPGAEALLPGGDAHETFITYLDRFADFVAGLEVTTEGGTERIPVIFRPWHEHNGDWFWWGKRHTSEREFIALWRFTVEYLRDEKQLHNLLYAFSPDRSRIDIEAFEQEYLYAYPGDDYVDILGLDNYWDLGHSANDTPRDQAQAHFVTSLSGVATIAARKGKVSAMTEGGQDTLFNENFWTERLLAGLLANDQTQQIAYVLVWRNANREHEQREHFYAPYPGHASEADFVEFYRHPATLFESDLPNLYEMEDEVK